MLSPKIYSCGYIHPGTFNLVGRCRGHMVNRKWSIFEVHCGRIKIEFSREEIPKIQLDTQLK